MFNDTNLTRYESEHDVARLRLPKFAKMNDRFNESIPFLQYPIRSTILSFATFFTPAIIDSFFFSTTTISETT